MLKRIKTIASYRGLAQWLAELENDGMPAAWLARVQVEEIPSPYAYSPTKPILVWQGRCVVYFETRHRHYEIFEVPATLLRFSDEEKATSWHIRFSRKPAA